MSLRAQNKARARQGILDAAHALILENGVAAVTTREIAKRAGVSYQTFYNYFPTKGSVIQTLLSEDLQLWSQAAHLIIKQYDGDLLATLADVAALGVTHFDGPRSELWIAVAPAFLQRTPPEEKHDANQSDAPGFDSLLAIAAERYHELLAMAQGTGELAQEVDLALLAHTIFTLHDHALMRYLVQPSQSLDALINVLDEQMHMLIGPYLNRSDKQRAQSNETRPRVAADVGVRPR